MVSIARINIRLGGGVLLPPVHWLALDPHRHACLLQHTLMLLQHTIDKLMQMSSKRQFYVSSLERTELRIDEYTQGLGRAAAKIFETQ